MPRQEPLKERNQRMAREFLERHGVPADDPRYDAVLDVVDWIRQVHNREDATTWWRRGLLSEAKRKLIDTQGSGGAIDGVPLSVNIDSFRSTASHHLKTLKHFKAMPIPEIRGGRFDRGWIKQTQNHAESMGVDSVRKTLDQMHVIEARWFESLDADRKVQDFHAVPILWTSNKWAWFDLLRPECDDEANAMGHCGNGDSEGGCTLLSYRRILDWENGIYEPHLTFVLHTNGPPSAAEGGELGEMKGRGNDKPAERYHNAIVQLLTDPHPRRSQGYRVTGLPGGEYEPENDFSVFDLDEDQRTELFAERPEFKPFEQQYDEGRDPALIAKQILDRLYTKGFLGEETYITLMQHHDLGAWVKKDGVLPVGTFMNMTELVGQYGDSNLAGILSEIRGTNPYIPTGTEADAVEDVELPFDRMRNLIARETGDTDVLDAEDLSPDQYGANEPEILAAMKGTKVARAVQRAYREAEIQERHERSYQLMFESIKSADEVHVYNIDGDPLTGFEEEVVVALPFRRVLRLYDEELINLPSADIEMSNGLLGEAFPDTYGEIFKPVTADHQDPERLQAWFDSALDDRLAKLEAQLPELRTTPAMSM